MYRYYIDLNMRESYQNVSHLATIRIHIQDFEPPFSPYSGMIYLLN